MPAIDPGAREAEIRRNLRLSHRKPGEAPNADRIATWIARAIRVLSRSEGAHPGEPRPFADLSTIRRHDAVEDTGPDWVAEDHGASFVVVNHAGVRFRVTVEREWA